jgi:hypothetical protein
MSEEKLNITHFSVLSDFSKYPGGRLMASGKHSGEELRILLLDLLAKFDFVKIDLDGTLGYANCFLDEAFSYIRRHFRSKVSFTSVDLGLISSIYKLE